MIIRTAREEDLEALLSIYNYEVEHGTATFDMTPRTLEERRRWLTDHNRGNHPLLVAEKNGRPVGYASLSAYRAREAYEETVELSLYVDRNFRRQGIARALMGAILEEAGRRPDIHSVISVISGENEGSMLLHREFGFTLCGTIREAGKKFGRRLDIHIYQRMFREHGC